MGWYTSISPFPENGPRLDFFQLRDHVHLVDIIPEGKHDCRSSILKRTHHQMGTQRNQLTNMSSHEEDSISSDGDVSFHQKNPNTAYTFVDNKENEESSDDDLPP
jgi:hypothetical protein